MAPESVLLIVMHLSLTLYAVLGGADFGGGVWECNMAFRTSERERRLIFSAIGPVWEANHVWLIFVVVLAANAFPLAFAAACRALWAPLLLTLVGIVFRGSAFAFRAYSAAGERQQDVWNVVFALASTLAPLFLGAAIGAIASGRLSVTSSGAFVGDPLSDWLSPLSVFTAFFAVGMCAYLASFYLTREANAANDRQQTTIWRNRSLAMALGMGALSIAGLVILAHEAPALWIGFRNRGWPLIVVALGAGAFSWIAMWRSRYSFAAVFAAATVAAVIWGWGVAQYPLLIPPAMDVEAAKAPDNVIELLLIAVAAGALILLPSLTFLLVLFKTSKRVQPPTT